jgi:hypothetical protein
MHLTTRCILATSVLILNVAAHADASARWELHADFDDRNIPGAIADCTFKQEGERLSGQCEDATLIGQIKGDSVTWRLSLAGTHDTVIFTGIFPDDEQAVIVGKFSYAGKGEGSFLAIKH